MSCPYCDNGVIVRLVNYAGFHFDADAPIEEEDICDECGGSGIIPDGEVPRKEALSGRA